MDDIRIRAYESRDLASLMRVWEAASRAGHPFLSDSFILAEREQVRGYLPLADTWVCEEGGSPVAFISLIENEVGGLFVDPERQRLGLGRTLLAFAMSRHATLELDVFEENLGARAFYRRCGFVEASAHEHAGSGRRMVRMSYQPPQAGDSTPETVE